MVKNLRNGIVSLIVTFVAVWRDVTGSGHYRGLCNTTCNRDELWEALQEEWENFPQEAPDKLYESMLCRIAALIAARGGNTKYWIFYSKIFFCSFTIGHLFQPIADVQKNCTPLSRFTYSAFALGSFIWLKLYYIRCTTCLATVDTSLHFEILFPSYLRCVTSLFAHVVQYFWMPLYQVV